MEKKLSDFKYSESGVVKFVEGEGRIRRRLFDMGITPGAKVKLRKKAPLGDPMEITIRGYDLERLKLTLFYVLWMKRRVKNNEAFCIGW